MASKTLYPTFLYSVPAEACYKDKAPYELSSALASHSPVDGSTASISLLDKAANSFN